MIDLQSALRSGSGLAPREQPRQWGVSEAKTSLVPPAAKTGMADEWLPFFVGLHVWGTDFSPAFESFVGAQVSLRLLDGRCYEVLRVPVALRRSCSTHARVELSFWDMYIWKIARLIWQILVLRTSMKPGQASPEARRAKFGASARTRLGVRRDPVPLRCCWHRRCPCSTPWQKVRGCHQLLTPGRRASVIAIINNRL